MADKDQLSKLQQAVLVIRKLERQLSAIKEPVAIIGMSAKLPGADNIDEFWKLLCEGKHGIKDVPKDRWDIDKYYDPDPEAPGKIVTRKGGFIANIDKFDADFFGISPREAKHLDPQQRILLEQTWIALENAAIAPDSLRDSQTGVFIGISTTDYRRLLEKYEGEAGIDAYLGTGNAFSTATGRLAYTLGLQGPNMAIETACSSSLVALHEACKSLQLSECDLAIVGGVNAILSPDISINFSRAGMLAPDGFCKTFDERANGYVRGEGCGIVILKKLSAAMEDNDRILAVIQATGINQDGLSSGLTVPNGDAQEKLLKSVLAYSGLKSQDIDYVECHGTGTSLGDPIEVHSIGRVYGKSRDKNNPIKLGSVKTNLGHLEAAAGIAGLIKVVLSLNNKLIPAHLNFKKINPNIILDFPAEIITEKTSWEKADGLRYAALSSFGFSGTNAHVIVSEAPEQKRIQSANDANMVMRLAAHSKPALNAVIDNLVKYLELHPNIPLNDLVYTTNICRAKLKYNCNFIANNHADLITDLRHKKITDLPERSPKLANKLILPTYPFERKRYWFDLRGIKNIQDLAKVDHEKNPLLIRQISWPEEGKYVFEADISKLNPSFLADHRIYKQTVMAGATFLATIISAVKELHDAQEAVIESIEFIQPVIFGNTDSEDTQRTLQLQIQTSNDAAAFKFLSFRGKDSERLLHVQGEYRITSPDLVTDIDSLQNIKKRCVLSEVGDKQQKNAAHVSLELGPSFLWLEQFGVGESEILAKLREPNEQESRGYVLHPGFIDSCFQAFAFSLPIEKLKILLIPFEIKSFNYNFKNKKPKFIYIKFNSEISEINKDSQTTVDFYFIDEKGVLVAKLSGLTLRAIPKSLLQSILTGQSEQQRFLYCMKWQDYNFEYSELNYDLEKYNQLQLIFSNKSSIITKELNKQLALHDIKSESLNIINDADKFQKILDDSSELISSSKDIWLVFDYDDVSDILAQYRFVLRVALLLIKKLLSQKKLPRFWLVVNNLYVITQSDRLNLTISGLSGFFKTLMQEHPELSAKLIDVGVVNQPNKAVQFLLQNLLNTFANTDSAETILAYRDNKIYVPRLLRLSDWRRLTPEINRLAVLPEIDQHKTIIIVGGLGGIGSTLASDLIKHGAKHLILLGRSVLNKEYKNILHKMQNDKDVIINYHQVDITQKNSVKELFAELRKQKIKLQAIFNAAGVLDDATIANLHWDAIEKVITPKVDGTWNVFKALTDEEQRSIAIISFSSSTSTIGAGGQAHYAAANSFLDAFSEQQNLLNYPVQTIAWGPWANVGMAKALSVRHGKSGIIALKPQSGIEVLSQILQTPNMPSVISAADIRWDKVTLAKIPAFLNKLMTSSKSGELLNHLLELPKEERLPALVQNLKQIVGDVTGKSVEKILEHEGFFDIGMDSLMVIELRNRLQSKLGGAINLDSTVIFDKPNVAELANFLANELQLTDLEPKYLTAQKPQPVGAMQNEPIAIIGMSARLPGAENIEEFWDMLSRGEDGITEVPADRWDINKYYDPDPDSPGKMVTRKGGFIKNIDQFDANFFGISAREAEFLDPQQRLLLEQTWQALENAAIAPSSLYNTDTGVFIGITSNDYSILLNKYSDVTDINAYLGTGNAYSTATGRISYTLGLRGPNMAIETACSSSLVALHEACKSLQRSECSMAIIGGVNAILAPDITINFSKAGMLAPDGYCKTFDEKANGYVRGEGCGIIILKKLSAALLDKDNIISVVKSSGINQDGASSGLTVPNGDAQVELLSAVLKEAELQPEDIGYVECHGTGTSLGDPIELRAIGKVYGKRSKEKPIKLGSVKTNIGHLEAAAGVAGLIKVILSLQHDLIPKHLHFTKLNSHINLDFPAEIVTSKQPWEPGNKSRYAAISSFGFSGTNAHVILEEAPKQESITVIDQKVDWVMRLSAKTETALNQLIKVYIQYLEQHPDIVIADLVYSTNTGRDKFKYTVNFKASTYDHLLKNLKTNKSTKQTAKSPEKANKIPLPTYPFERQRYWAKLYANEIKLGGTFAANPLLGQINKQPNGYLCTKTIKIKELNYLSDHIIYGHVLFPGAAFIEVVNAAIKEVLVDNDYCINDLTIHKPLKLSSEKNILSVFIDTKDAEEIKVNIHEKIGSDKEKNLQYDLLVSANVKIMAQRKVEKLYLNDILNMSSAWHSSKLLYSNLKKNHIAYGSYFQTLQRVRLHKDFIMGEIETNSNVKNYTVHPTILDGAFHALIYFLFEGKKLDYIEPIAALPINFNDCYFSKKIGNKCYAYIKNIVFSDQIIQAELYLLDKYGDAIGYIKNIKLKYTTAAQLAGILSNEQRIENWFYNINWYVNTLQTISQNNHDNLKLPIWIIYYENDASQKLIAEHIASSFVNTTRIQLGNSDASANDKNVVTVKAQEFETLFSVKNNISKPKYIVYLAAISQTSRKYTKETILALNQRIISDFLAVNKHVFSMNTEISFWVFTNEAYQIGKNPGVNLLSSPLNGLFKVLLWEYPAIEFHQVDVSSSENVSNILIDEILSEVEDNIVAYRNNTRFSPRLVSCCNDLNCLHVPDHNFKLVKAPSNKLSDLEFVAQGLSGALEGHQVEIKVHAVGLNFRDVLNAIGQYPGNPGSLGIDAVGSITRLGKQVKNFNKGDIVFGMVSGALADHAITDQRLIAKLPETLNNIYPDLTFAAAIPTIFMTAYYALVKLAKLKSKDKILIHAATGGVGQAAIQIAQHIGAEVYATAGNEAKRKFLKSQGIKYIYNSRSTDYCDQILAATQQTGVDVVLNCLSGPGFIESTIKTSAKKARFCEIGKIDIWSIEKMRKIRPDIDYQIIALDDLAINHPDKIQSLLKTIITHFDHSNYQPIKQTVFPADQVILAFNFLRQAKQIGKVIVDLRHTSYPEIKKLGCYLITGGLGGLGMQLLDYLLASGVSNILLTSRYKPDESQIKKLENLSKKYKAHIKCIKADISNSNSIVILNTFIASNKLSINGIFHLAGMVDDAVFDEMSWSRFFKVFQPKICGTWHLHQLCQQLNSKPDFFVNFSSIASAIGSAGQSNYAAANSFLDAFAIYQTAHGIKTFTINWGAFAEVGMAKNLVSHHAKSGLLPMSPKDGMRALSLVIRNALTNVVVANIDFKNLSKNPFLPNWLDNLVASQKIDSGELLKLLQSLPVEQRQAALTDEITSLVAEILNTSVDQLSADKGFFDLGMDSLMAVELRNRIQAKIGKAAQLNSTIIFDYPRIDKLAAQLAQQLKLVELKPQAQMQIVSISPQEPIAIIGMSAKFPGANDISEFWQLLHEGKDGIQEVPKDRWDIDQYYDPDPDKPGKMVTRKGGFINDIDKFDANFFGISPREAEYLDPQQRLLLEQTWQALECANISATQLEGSDTGVFVGMSTFDYNILINKFITPDLINAYIGTGTAFSTATGRISYILGLQGPNMAIETACSSSLVALHEAVRALRQGECPLAIVGGVNAILTPETSINFSKAGMLAPDGFCKTFDERADGYVRGEGCGVVILKCLSDAKRDHDNILAVIKASGINQDGTSSGLTVPNGDAQEKLLVKVLAESKLKPNDIDYVECHGTGTSLGDPIEIHAIGKVYGKRAEDNPIRLGSVKTNVGHLEAAAGMAGLIKTVLALQHQEIPKHLHFHKLNPHISLSFPAEIVIENHEWKSNGQLRYAAVSSFGFSGTNAHVILERAPKQEHIKVADKKVDWVMRLSAKTETALQYIIQNYINYLNQDPNVSIADLVYSTNTGRANFKYTAKFKASSYEELLKNLKANKTTQQAEKAPEKANKIILPNYPFERQRYWLKLSKQIESVEPDLSQWCYQQQWQSLVVDKVKQKIAYEKVAFVSFNSEAMTNWKRVATQLLKNQAAVTEILLKDKGLKTQLGNYFRKNTYEKIFVLCKLWNLDHAVKEGQKYLYLLSQLSNILAKEKTPPQLVVITEQLYAHAVLTKAKQVNVLAAVSFSPLIGFVKSLQIEIPLLKTCLLDMKNLAAVKDAQVALSSLESLPVNENIIAYYSRKFYAPRIAHYPVVLDRKAKFSGQATYLITGGLGGLGQVITQWLLDQGVKHIVLIGRHKPTKKVKQRLDTWQANGVDVQVQLADVSDKSSIKQLITQLSKNKYPLHGIFHLAGIEHFGLINQLIEKEVAQVLAAKVAGGIYLHELTKDLKLKYFVLFSSISAFLGSQKQALYAAANQALDSLASYRRAHKLPVTCIDWGPWTDSGMAAAQLNAEKLAQFGLTGDDLITPTVAKRALSLLLAQPQQSSIAIVSPHYLRFMLDFMPDPLPFWVRDIKVQLPRLKVFTEVNTQELIQKWVSLTESERKIKLEDILRSVVANVLGVENPSALDASLGFFEMGMDSLMAVELQKQLQQQLGNGIEIKANLGFDYPTIAAVTDYLYSQLFEVTATSAIAPTVTAALNETIAIVGMGCRFPGHANTPEAFWTLMANGQGAITDVPETRWIMDTYYDSDPDAPGKSYTRKAAFIDDIEQFDATFFNISPREAQTMDPQQRLVLEVSYHALEDAGYTLNKIKGTRGGVFIGVGANEYTSQLNQRGKLTELDAYFATGGALNVIAGRVSYTYGLEGPSEIIDTACSSSLVALHNAVQALRNNECEFAIAGGVNAMISPETFIMLSKAKMLAADGFCKTFDAKADGYVRGEGCGMVILKRLSDAERDGDRILAVIKGSAVNQDGASSGLTVPRGTSQAGVIQQALQNANVPPAAVDYVEAHGTGTSLGDPIEVETLSKIYGKAHGKQPFILGTVKTNIGHLESAAGIAGVIKVILSLRHEQIPPHLNFNELNPHIDLVTAHAQLPLKTMSWKVSERTRMAGISSFGFSGTNAHVILAEAPKQNTIEASDKHTNWVITLSAKTQIALAHLIKKYIDYLENNANVSITDLVYTANNFRNQFNIKANYRASTVAELLNCLKANKTTKLAIKTPTKGNRIDLPDYPFERKRFWLLEAKQPMSGVGASLTANTHPFMLRQMSLPDEGKYIFETDVSSQWPEFVPDHLIYDKPVIAGATYISAMLSIIQELHNSMRATIENIEFIQPLVLDQADATKTRTIQINIDRSEDEGIFKVVSFTEKNGERSVHAEGKYYVAETELTDRLDSLDKIKNRCTNTYSNKEHIKNTQAISLKLGHHFHWISTVNFNKQELLATMRLPDAMEKKNYILYPGFIDSCFQTLLAFIGKNVEILSIPLSIGKFTYMFDAPKLKYVYVKVHRNSSLSVNTSNTQQTFDIFLLDAEGSVKAKITKFVGRPVPKNVLLQMLSKQSQQHKWLYVNHWQKVVMPDLGDKPISHQQSNHLILNPYQCILSQALAKRFTQTGIMYDLKSLDLKEIRDLVDSDSRYSDLWLFLGGIANDEKDILKQYRDILKLILMTVKLANNINQQGIRFWIVTEGLYQVEPHDAVNLAMSGVVGFYKTLLQEHPELQARLIDFNCMDDATNNVDQLFSQWQYALTNPDNESIVAYRQGNRYVPRLIHVAEQRRLDQYRELPKFPYHLVFERGSIVSMQFAEFDLPKQLKPYEAEISLQSAAINFRDVLNVQGLYPGDAGDAGGDCSGIVTRVGKSVEHIKPGDYVFGMSGGTFASHAVGPADWLLKCPKQLDAITASTLPAVFITSYVCLIELAKLKSTDIVLLHAASGGVGLAAIQIAQHTGAKIVATAGSERKRNYLRQLGIKHVFDSRSFDYVEPIKQLTKGKGVNVVLNFLVGDFIAETLKVTADGARFIEIGKRDIYTLEKMHRVRPDVEYHIYALDEMMMNEPQHIRLTLDKLAKGVNEGYYTGLPATSFTLPYIIPAFNYMRSAQHIGKVVLIPPRASLDTIDPNKTQVVIGGLGGIGFNLAKELIQRGSKRLVITGRNALIVTQQQAIRTLTDNDSSIAIDYQCVDMTKQRSIAKLLEYLRQSKYELQTIFNTAGVIDDATIDTLTWHRVEKVITPKVDGTWHLYQALTKFERQHVTLVSFSSIAATLGSGGQAHYAAANSFLDTFSEWLQRQHYLAQSIAWGPWASIGMAKDLTSRHAKTGLIALNSTQAINTLLQLLESNNTPAAIAVADINWQKIITTQPPAFLSSVIPKVHKKVVNILNKVKTYADKERAEILNQHVCELIANVMGLAEGSVPVDKNFFEIGMDSLMAVELRNQLVSHTGGQVELSPSSLFEHNTVNKLTRYILANAFENKSVRSKRKISTWLKILKPYSNIKAHLICLPYIGMMNKVLTPWFDMIPAGVELSVVQLPGHMERLGEDFSSNIEEVVESIYREIGNKFHDTKPIIIFGHSFGTILALSLAQKLQQENKPLSALIVSSLNPPVSGKENVLKRNVRAIRQRIVDDLEASIKADKVGVTDELKQQLKTITENSLQIMKGFQPNAIKLSVPIHFFAGKDDDFYYAKNTIGRWKNYTTDTFTKQLFSGGHFYFFDDPSELIKSIFRKIKL